MGAISFSIDRTCVELLVRRLGLARFVETGTFKGDSIARIRDLFTSVLSVEIDPALAGGAAQRFAGDAGVEIRIGSSPAVLADLTAAGPSDSRTLWWLDAHWCQSGSSGADGQCPLLGELDAIDALGADSVIAIDDARLFLAPPTAVHRIAEWPTFDAILARIRRIAPGHRIAILNDVIWIIPALIEPAFLDHAARTGVDWLAIAEKGRTYDAVMAQLEEKDGEIRRLSEEGDRRLAVLATVHAEAEARAREVERLHGELQEIHLRAEQDRNALEAKEKEISLLSGEAEKRLRALESVRNALEAKEREVGLLSGETEKHRAELESLRNETLRTTAEREASQRTIVLLQDELIGTRSRLQQCEYTCAASHDQAANCAGELAAAFAELQATREDLAARTAVIDSLNALLVEANADRVARGEVIGRLQGRIAELEGHLVQLDGAIADATATAAAHGERAAMLESVACERAALIDRLDRLAREAGERAAAAEAVRAHLEREVEVRHQMAIEAASQAAELSASAETAHLRATAAERERDARQAVIDELVRARDALSAALHRHTPTWLDRLLKR